MTKRLQSRRWRATIDRWTTDGGASAVEYALLAVAIAAVIVAIVFGLGTLVEAQFSTTSDRISTEVNAAA
jgi:pilus assembly protein Flp/PilA